MNIIKIGVVKNSGTVEVYFYTDLPPVMFPYNEGCFFFKAEMRATKYSAYLVAHFPGIPVTVVG